MPLFTVELNRLATALRGTTDWTAYLHTAAPTDADPTNGRTTVGGGAFENGLTVPISNVSMASNGDINVSAALAFGTADEAVGTVTHVSYYQGTAPKGFSTIPSTTIGNGDTFTINTGTAQLNGSST